MPIRDARSELPHSAPAGGDHRHHAPAGGAHLHRLDLMRFIAASLVVLFHFGSFGYLAPEQDAPVAAQAFPWLGVWGWFGWVGVPVFFCLSGYVIARSALEQSPLAFLKRRMIRILPMLWIGALMAFAIRLIWGEDLAMLLPDLFRNAVLSPKGPYIDGVVWTLVLEAVFYFMIMGLLACATGRAARIALFGRFALWLGGISSLFIAILALVTLTGAQIGGHDLAALLTRFPFKVVLLHHGVYFAIGMLLWLREEEALPRPGPICLALFTLAGLAYIALKGHGIGDPLDALWLPGALWLALTGLILLPGPILDPRRRPRLSRAFRFAGLMTYPIYLGHFTLGMYGVPLAAPLFQRGSPLFFLASMLAVFGLAAVMAWGPERWLQRALRQVLLPRRKAASVTPG